MNIWAYSLISVSIISLVSFVGLFFLALKKEALQRILLFLVSFSAGGLLGGAFIHLLPEAVNLLGLGFRLSLAILFGILVFFILEKFIFWRHCHLPTDKPHPHPLAFMNLLGDILHNFIDGIVVTSSFLVSIPLGLTTAFAVLLHQIPKEIGDCSILIYSGFSKIKSLFLNFASALSALVGALLILIIGTKFAEFNKLIIPFAVGSFIYVAGSDLIPELHKETGVKKSALQLLGLILGIGAMAVLALLE